MYLKLKDFITDWKQESTSTIKVFSNISDEVKSIKTKESIRSLERLAWHITQTLTEMPYRAGILEEDVLEKKNIPDSFSEIIEIYKKHSTTLVELIQKKWGDNDLTIEIEVYGQVWEKRKILSSLIHHQIHHRGQMTILMRLHDMGVPGVYGPSKEEWSQYGMDAQE